VKTSVTLSDVPPQRLAATAEEAYLVSACAGMCAHLAEHSKRYEALRLQVYMVLVLLQRLEDIRQSQRRQMRLRNT